MHEKSKFYGKKVVKQLYFSGPLACTELSEAVGKSIPIVTKVLNELVDQGIVAEKGLAPSTGGRRSLMYEIKADIMYIVSVAMDQFLTRIVILDMHNNVVFGLERFELPLSTDETALSLLIEKIDWAIETSGIDRKKIIGIGIGMPGFVDPMKGVNYSFLQVPGSSITEFVQDRLCIPTFIDNDSSLIALAELRFGIARHCKTAMVINIGWGIGLGLIVDKVLYRGENGFAGEFSHIPLFLNGKLCGCGKRGCLETEASLLVVLEKAREGLRSGKQSLLKELPEGHLEEEIEAVIKAAGKGDQYAIGLLSDAGYIIGRGAAVLIHLLNPEVIILSGRGASPGIVWQTPIQQALNEHCIPRLSSSTSVKISQLGLNAGIIGAASLVMENYDQLVEAAVV